MFNERYAMSIASASGASEQMSKAMAMNMNCAQGGKSQRGPASAEVAKYLEKIADGLHGLGEENGYATRAESIKGGHMY